MESALVEEITKKFDGATPRESIDHPAVNIPVDLLLSVVEWLRDEKSFDLLMDVTAIDWSEDASPRFTGIYHLASTTKHEYIRLASNCEDDVEPELPTLSKLFPAANWHERETYDMLGIRYKGHPDLRRILMWDDYPYHPLRKEFPLAGIDTDLPAADVAEATGAKVIPAPMMGGPFHAPQTGAMSKREPRAADQSWNEAKPKPSTN
ncbi:NADH-quinone oxidoreductase subunit C [Cerasicoccus fimbriatus]|uniref:NADH-quinone oxidoreductase subunit C n=1 Tax=Cerasicoccus fimbriatus TaxID=3014554 RepID=UPI0022B34EE1|nr:NADH-quinone oxidoreductase subunit C [Cerasicoccus sp. TK19100]